MGLTNVPFRLPFNTLSFIRLELPPFLAFRRCLKACLSYPIMVDPVKHSIAKHTWCNTKGLRLFGIVAFTVVINCIIKSGFYYGCSSKLASLGFGHLYEIKCSHGNYYDTFGAYTELLEMLKELQTLYL